VADSTDTSIHVYPLATTGPPATSRLVPDGRTGSYILESPATRGWERTRTPSVTVTASVPLVSLAIGVALGLGLGAALAEALGDGAGGVAEGPPEGEAAADGDVVEGGALAADGVGAGDSHAVVSRRTARSRAPIRRG
jgi:hypothetical protein